MRSVVYLIRMTYNDLSPHNTSSCPEYLMGWGIDMY